MIFGTFHRNGGLNLGLRPPKDENLYFFIGVPTNLHNKKSRYRKAEALSLTDLPDCIVRNISFNSNNHITGR